MNEQKAGVSEATAQRCAARMPGTDHSTAGMQCGNFDGHDGDHTLLMPSNAPWFDSKWKEPALHTGGSCADALRELMAQVEAPWDENSAKTWERCEQALQGSRAFEARAQPDAAALRLAGDYGHTDLYDLSNDELLDEFAAQSAVRSCSDADERATAAKEILLERLAELQSDEDDDADLTPEEMAELDDFGAVFKQMVEADFEAYKHLASTTINNLARELSAARSALAAAARATHEGDK